MKAYNEKSRSLDSFIRIIKWIFVGEDHLTTIQTEDLEAFGKVTSDDTLRLYPINPEDRQSGDDDGGDEEE